MSAVRTAHGRSWQVDLAGAAVCVGLTLLFYLAGVLPLSRLQAAQLEQQTELETRREKATRLAAAADTLQRRLKQVGQALGEAPVQLRSARELNQRLARLTNLAGECGLAIDQTHSDRPHNGPWYQTVPIRLAGKGAYPTCAVFLDQIRRAYPDMGVSSFELAGEPGSNAPAAFRFDLVWYTQRLDQ